MATALLIDDHPVNSELIEVYLQRYDIQTVICYSGQEGFAAAQMLQPDIIFLDLLMPQETWDGYKTLAMLKSYPDTKHIAVIVVSAAGNLDRAIEGGCTDTLRRPFRFYRLQEILNLYIGL